jgi:hypothetical protein
MIYDHDDLPDATEIVALVGTRASALDCLYSRPLLTLNLDPNPNPNPST